MNRHERRAAGIQKSKLAGYERALVEIPCTGPLSSPRQICSQALAVPMPFDLEGLRSRAWTEGWVTTVVTPPGVTPPHAALLCPSCAEALVPELLAAARPHMPGSA